MSNIFSENDLDGVFYLSETQERDIISDIHIISNQLESKKFENKFSQNIKQNGGNGKITFSESSLMSHILENELSQPDHQTGGDDLSLTSSMGSVNYQTGGNYSITSDIVPQDYQSSKADLVKTKKSSNKVSSNYKINQNNLSETSSAYPDLYQSGGDYSATSNPNSGQINNSVTKYQNSNNFNQNFISESVNEFKDINKLISMITSDSKNSDQRLTDTTTEKLEEKLKNLLQAASYQIINNQSNKQINQYDLFSENSNTTTTINNNQNGGSNPGFKAFLDLKKYVATKLKIPNGPKAASIASAVQKDVKMKYPDLKDSLKIVEKAKEHFNKSPNKYYHN